MVIGCTLDDRYVRISLEGKKKKKSRHGMPC